MYLVDEEIRNRLGELSIRCPDQAHQFDADRQIQPCSIDLHVSNVFWRPRHRRRALRRLLARLRGGSIDLRRGDIGQLRLLRDWQQFELREGQAYIIHPGEVLMGRVYERFTVPDDCAGKIEGRSSYSRLGLAVHLTGDFINPGWSGYMPVQLFNAGPYPIRITPFLPICQLMLIPLTGTPQRTYGDPKLQSKYVNDDGGPSLWWRDAQVERLRARLDKASVAADVQSDVIDRFRGLDPAVSARLEAHLERRLDEDDVQDADSLLKGFAKRERSRKLRDEIVIAAPPLLLAALLSSLFTDGFETTRTVCGALLVGSLPLALFAWNRRERGYCNAIPAPQRDV